MNLACSSAAPTACARPRDLDPRDFADARGPGVVWDGEVLVHFESGSLALRGIELTRTEILLTGDWRLAVGQNVTLELQLERTTIFVVASVEWSLAASHAGVNRLRFSVTSPEGNDLIAKTVRQGNATPTEREMVVRLVPRRPATMCCAA